MRTPFLFLSILGIYFTTNLCCAQSSVRAKIEKNLNLRASLLSHELNTTKDTLLLKSANKINQVYSINESYKREIDVYLDVNEYKIPLNTLSKGKHVLVVGLSPKKIVFVVQIYEEAPLISVDKTQLTYSEN